MVVLNRLFYHFIHFPEKSEKNVQKTKYGKTGKLLITLLLTNILLLKLLLNSVDLHAETKVGVL